MPGQQRMPPMGFRPPPRYEEPDPNGEQFRKLFIGGLNFESNEASLRSYFSKWGDIVDCVVMRDNQTKRSRGFGFIIFKNKDSIDDVQNARKHEKHEVDARAVETKRAMPRDDPNANNQVTVNKVFVGGLKEDTTEDMIREVFSEYGNIKEVELIKDKASGKLKGFCFVTFDDYDPVDKLVLLRRISCNCKKVEVKKAYAKSELDRFDRYSRMGLGGPMQMPMQHGGRGDYASGYHQREFFGGYHNGQGMNHPGCGWRGPGAPYFNDFFNNHGNHQRPFHSHSHNNSYGHNHNYNRK